MNVLLAVPLRVEVVQLALVGDSWRNLSGGGSDGTGKPLGLNNGNPAQSDP